MRRDVGVILVAAGQGTRLGTATPKQFLELAGTPVLLRALRPFACHAAVLQIVIVVPRGVVESPPAWLGAITSDSILLVAGGDSRRDSVSAGLDALGAECAIVLVHDGARPFPPMEAIEAGIIAARAGHATVPALPLADTIKRADECGTVLATVSRAGLWRAQTPQAFPRAILERAHAQFPTHDVIVTDDATLVELLGHRVELLPGSWRNIKITSPEDLELAEWLATKS